MSVKDVSSIVIVGHLEYESDWNENRNASVSSVDVFGSALLIVGIWTLIGC